MDNFATHFGCLKPLRYGRVLTGWLYPTLCFLLLVGLLSGAASAAETPRSHPASQGPSLSFSVADFDGDSEPDLASVEYRTSDSARTDYLIQLQLSAAGWQSFQIPAPTGGLQIIARDVNGDHALDLVITTTWRREPVAVLLNDGHGNFSRVDPYAFPGAFREADSDWDSPTQEEPEAVGVSPQSRDEICLGTKHFLHVRAHTGLAPDSRSQFGFSFLLVSHRDRAPPSELPHS